MPEIYGRIAVYLQYRAFGKDCSRQSYCISSIRGGQRRKEINLQGVIKNICFRTSLSMVPEASKLSAVRKQVARGF